MVVIAFMGILLAMAFPSVSQWRKNAQYKETARQLAGAMMEARSRAISQNRQQEIAFDLVEDVYKLRELQSGTWVDIYPNRSVSAAIEIKAKSDCSENSAANYRFHFFPNGTFEVVGGTNVNDNYICIVDKATATTKFTVGIPAAATSRVVTAAVH
jgi:Tfp pilus assembly protein FimT